MNTDFLSQFGGAELMTNAKSSALRTMESGFAKLIGATLHTKTKDGRTTYSVKVDFDALALKQDGINDYIRSSRANDLAKGINKYKYLFIHSDNAEAKDAQAKLGNPFTPYMQEVEEIANQGTPEEVITKVMKPIIITSLKEELPSLRENHGEELDFVFVDNDKGSTCYAVKVTDAKAYCEALASNINLLVASESTYRLKITAGKNNFDQISNITKANL